MPFDAPTPVIDCVRTTRRPIWRLALADADASAARRLSDYQSRELALWLSGATAPEVPNVSSRDYQSRGGE